MGPRRNITLIFKGSSRADALSTAFRLETDAKGVTDGGMLSEATQAELIQFAEKLADVARVVILEAHAKVENQIEIKADGTPVTVADREAERLMRDLIKETYPQHGILGEEYGAERADAEICWVLDPIDGTKSFLSRVPLYTILIGLRYRGEPLLGLIDQPVLKERMIGDGKVTKLNGRVVRVAEVALRDAVVVGSDFDGIRKYQPQAKWNQLADAVTHTRTWGDGYGYLLVASGRAHVVADPIMNPWDIIPVLPILKGAGAVVTDWRGGNALEAGNIIAAAPRLHAAVLAKLNA